MRKVYFKNYDEVKSHILKKGKTLFLGSKTSTVLPFEVIESVKLQTEILGELSSIPGKIEMRGEDVFIEGNVTWEDLKGFLRTNNRDLMASPTEKLALVLSGIATSATGERAFGLGTLRDQLEEVNFICQDAKELTLFSDKRIENILSDDIDLSEYQKSYEAYKDFKNAPFPRFEFEIDLAVQTEGQLGVIKSAILKTVPYNTVKYLFFPLPKWEDNYSPHLEIYQKVQNFREDILACELIDENSISYLNKDDRPVDGKDLIFIELRESSFEKVYKDFISTLELVDEDQVFELNESACQDFRMKIPRVIFEQNSRQGVTKKGTDVQVCTCDDFEKLLNLYRELGKKGIKYNMFGHFGDGHLHFNFMPLPSDEKKCQDYLQEFYNDVLILGGSPFAEHGIGVLKKEFIEKFYTDTHLKVFKKIKDSFDKDRIFFPDGFLNISQEKN